MVDNLTFALTHGLLALALWRLLYRDDLDADPIADGDDPDSDPRVRHRPGRPGRPGARAPGFLRRPARKPIPGQGQGQGQGRGR